MALTIFSDLQTEVQRRLGLGSVSTSQSNRTKACINAAIAQLSADSATDILNECVNAAIAELSGNLDTDLLNECVNAAIAQLTVDQDDFTSDSLDEALNAGIARAISDGIPGLTRDIFTTKTWSTFSTTLVHSAGSSTATFSDASPGTINIYAHDLVKVGSDFYTIREYSSASTTATLDFGATLPDSIAGAATIYRRSIALPTSGKVIFVRDITNDRELPYDPKRTYLSPDDTGEPYCIDQRWDKNAGKSILTLFPAPDSQVFLQIQQQENYAKDGSLSWPEEALDAVLERSRAAWMSFRGELVTPVEASLMASVLKDTDDQLKDSSSAHKIFIRG